MAKSKTLLSPADRLILDSYKATIDGLAAYYGDAFEIVLHDLTDLDHSIIKIANGFHSGRKEGAPITDLALSLLEEIRGGSVFAEQKIQDDQEIRSYSVYVSASKYSKPVNCGFIRIQNQTIRR
jgi:predicted transcriptional regulator YheO